MCPYAFRVNRSQHSRQWPCRQRPGKDSRGRLFHTFPLAGSSLAVVLFASGVMGCDQPPQPSTKNSAGAPLSDTLRVTVLKPERMTIRRTTEQPGQIQAFETTPVHARIGGYVKMVTVNIGDRVKAGQLLAELDVPEVEAEARQKVAAVEQARADRSQAEAAVAVAKSAVATAQAKAAEVQATTRRTVADVSRWEAEAARIEQLARESAVTGSLRDETRSKLEAARAAADEAKAHVRSAEAALDEARSALDKSKADSASSTVKIKVAKADQSRVEAMLGFAKITAPYDGVVTRRHIDPGHLTVPGGTGEPLFVVARTEVVSVVVAVPEVESALVESGDPAKIRIQSLAGREVSGKVARTSWALDQGTRSLRVEIDLPNADGALRPGMYAYTTIVASERADVLTLPVSAIIREPGKAYCVVAEEGKARRRPLRVGLSDGIRIEILEGLATGVTVIASGADLAEGQAVQLVPQEKPAEPPKK